MSNESLRSRFRTFTDGMVTALAILATLIVVAPLVAIFVYLLYKGTSSLNLAFFTQIPKPVGESGGGMANAILRIWNPSLRCQLDRCSYRHRWRHLSRPVRSRNSDWPLRSALPPMYSTACHPSSWVSPHLLWLSFIQESRSCPLLATFWPSPAASLSASCR